MSQQAELKIVGGKHDGKVIPLAEKKFLIGREQDCHLRPNSDLVSRHHCVFTIDDYAVRLRDLGSTNGTLVNGERLHGETVLKTGDEIVIGKLTFIASVRTVENAAPTPSAEPEAIADLPIAAPDAVRDAPTMTEMPAFSPDQAPPAMPMPTSDTVFGGDTTIFAPGQAPGAPQAPGEPPPMYYSPQGAPPPQMYPPGFPYPYPTMPGYAYPPPGYPMPPQGQYPQAGQYPQQGQYPPQGQYPGQAPPQEQPSPAPQATEKPAKGEAIPTRLPAPESTGAEEVVQPTDAEKKNAAVKASQEENPSNRAADIIKQFMQKRVK